MRIFDVSMISGLALSTCKLLARQVKIVLVCGMAAAMLSSCGGGGGGGSAGPVTSTLSFPLQSGLRAMAAHGGSIDFTVSGTCDGSGNIASSIPLAATFENISGFSSASTFYLNFTNCSPPSIYSTSTDYYDNNYDSIGSIDSSGEYGVFSLPLSIPVSVKVGDAGTIGTKNYYSDSTKIFPTGHDEDSYVILPDTAETAIINMISKSYDNSNVLTSTGYDKYRIKADGSLSLISSEVQFTNGSTTHLMLNAIPDTVPPTILSTSPSNYSTNIPVYASIVANFSEAIDQATVTSAEFTLMDGTTPVSGTVMYNGNSASFTPSSPLNPTTVYTARVSTGVKDLAGNAMSANYSWQFQTAAPDTTPPTVISTSPIASATGVAVASAITATFNEPIDPGTITTAGAFTLTCGANTVSGTVKYSGNTATFTPSAPLTPNTPCMAMITTAVKDLAGNAIGADYIWTFQTIVPTAPTVSSASPVPYDYAVATSSVVTATFSKPVDPATVNGASFTLVGGTTPVSGTVTYSGSTATFTPSAPLTENTVYRATITTDVKDMLGTPLSANYSWTFQTFAPGSSTGPVDPPPAGLWQPTPGSTPATGNFVYLKSDSGDYIGQGQTYTYTQATAILTVSATGGLLTVGVNGYQQWTGDFQAMNTLTQLQPGFYSGLTRYPFHNSVIGGLSWYGDGRGCNTLKGWFAIDNVTYDNGTLTAIDLRFEQNCEGGTTALHGAIHWTSSDTTTPSGPVDPPPAGLWQPAQGSTPASGNFVYLQSDSGDYIGQGQTYTYTPATAVLSVSASGGRLTIGVSGFDIWTGIFQTMYTLSQLQPGYYPNLTRGSPAFGSLDWFGNGRGCNTLTGWFAVDNVTYVGSTLTAIDLRFEQHCDGIAAALHGAIHWAP